MGQVDLAQLDAHRSALMGHCYRMLGSVVDADDAVQETMIRAVRGLDCFDGRASLRTWMYRIATNVCLDALAKDARRARPVEDGPMGGLTDELMERPRSHWLEPVPDARALPQDCPPDETVILRQSIRLAFVAAMQHLPPRQRAALLLTEVLGFSAAEAADTLTTSVASVNSALQRARATLAQRDLADAREDLSEAQRALVDRYAEAFERYDVDALTTLMHEDAVLSMPPFTLWLQGPETIQRWLLGRGAACRGSRLLPTAASGLPAFGQYRCDAQGRYHPWSLIVLELRGPRVQAMTHFLDTETLFPLFGLPDAPPEAQTSTSVPVA